MPILRKYMKIGPVNRGRSRILDSSLSRNLRLRIENGKWKVDNYGVAFGDLFKSFPKEIPQFSIVNCQFSIRA